MTPGFGVKRFFQFGIVVLEEFPKNEMQSFTKSSIYLKWKKTGAKIAKEYDTVAPPSNTKVGMPLASKVGIHML